MALLDPNGGFSDDAWVLGKVTAVEVKDRHSSGGSSALAAAPGLRFTWKSTEGHRGEGWKLTVDKKRFKLDAYTSYWVVFGPSTMAGKIKAAAAAANKATAATASASAAAAKALKRAVKASAKKAKAKANANAKADAAPVAGTKTKKRKQSKLDLDDSEDEAPPGCYKCRFISTCTCDTPQPNPHTRTRTK
jgi:hypothetical protein